MVKRFLGKCKMRNWIKWGLISSMVQFFFMVVAPIFSSAPIVLVEYLIGLILIWVICFIFVRDSNLDSNE